MSKELKLCPFCGGRASYDRVGTNRQSCIVICEDCGCMVESNETGEYCGNKWNIRQESQAQSKALTKEVIDEILQSFCHDGDRPEAVNMIYAALPSETAKDQRIKELETELQEEFVESTSAYNKIAAMQRQIDDWWEAFEQIESLEYPINKLEELVMKIRSIAIKALKYQKA